MLTFSSGSNSYTLSLVGRVQTLFSEKNLRRLDALSEQLGKSAYIEKTGEKQWFTPESQRIEDMWMNDYQNAENKFSTLPREAQDAYNREKEQMQLFSSDAIYIEMPDHTTAIYTLRVPFEKVENPDE